MNSQEEISKRILKLYPTKVLKGYFKSEEKRLDDILEEIIHTTGVDVKKFAFINFDYTKQHIYFFTHSIKSLKHIPEKLTVDCELYNRIIQEDEINFFYFYQTNYKIITEDENLARQEIKFKVPFKILINKDILRIDFTIIEKNISSYLEGNRIIINRGKTVSEEDIITKIKSALGDLGQLSTLDLHKGIKALWKNNIIDAVKVKHTEAKSTSTIAMHEEFLFKKSYPKKYEEIENEILGKTIFRFTNKDKTYKHFAIDPNEGILYLSTFAEFRDNKENVIREILEYN